MVFFCSVELEEKRTDVVRSWDELSARRHPLVFSKIRAQLVLPGLIPKS